MPTTSVAAAEEWRRLCLEPLMVMAHDARKSRGGGSSSNPREPSHNPIDEVLFGVLPRLLLDRIELLRVLGDAGLEPDPDEFEAIGAGLAGHLRRVLVDEMGLPFRRLNLPTWLEGEE
jgi:hypothetical protein